MKSPALLPPEVVAERSSATEFSSMLPPDVVERVRAVRAGAVGYVLKRVGSSDLVDAIRTVGKGDALIDPTMTKALLEEVRRRADDQEGVHAHSCRGDERPARPVGEA